MINMKPIGIVHNEVNSPFGGTGNRPRGWGNVLSDLVLEEQYADALDGLEEYSDILVIFWIDRSHPPESMKRHAQGREELPVIGIFAGRAPYRPNPIGLTAVALLGRDRNTLKVQGLDAIDGTPLLDIKPYTPAFDLKPDAKVPDWCRQLFEREDYF
jgi:tRNA-Thr(GGU) m(6)t(6)A37 methyltransferase TsaA